MVKVRHMHIHKNIVQYRLAISGSGFKDRIQCYLREYHDILTHKAGPISTLIHVNISAICPQSICHIRRISITAATFLSPDLFHIYPAPDPYVGLSD